MFLERCECVCVCVCARVRAWRICTDQRSEVRNDFRVTDGVWLPVYIEYLSYFANRSTMYMHVSSDLLDHVTHYSKLHLPHELFLQILKLSLEL